MSLTSVGRQGATPMNQAGIPIVPPPDKESFRQRIKMVIIRSLIFPIVIPSFLLVSYVCKKSFRELANELYSIVDGASKDPVSGHFYFQDPDLLRRLWETPSARHYIQTGALLYQMSEGFCGSTTRRVILKSFTPRFPSELVPHPQQESTTPASMCQRVQELEKDRQSVTKIKTKVVLGADVGYDEFLRTLKQNLADGNCRVAVNYLRPAMVGFQWPRWVSSHLFLGLFSGHFSPVVGIVERPAATSSSENEKDDPLVGIFDVNADWKGAYLVPATKLYASVKAMDFSTGTSRGIVIFKMAA